MLEDSFWLVGTGEFESPTSTMSTWRSNQLSYAPISRSSRRRSIVENNSQKNNAIRVVH